MNLEWDPGYVISPNLTFLGGRFMVKHFLIVIIYLLTFLSADDELDKLNSQLFNVWTVEALKMKLMINNSIEYYVDANPEDSLKKIRQNDKIIIIESKKDPNENLRATIRK